MGSPTNPHKRTPRAWEKKKQFRAMVHEMAKNGKMPNAMGQWVEASDSFKSGHHVR